MACWLHIHRQKKASIACKGHILMRTTQSKVIKSEEVRFVHRTGKAMSGSDSVAGDGKMSGMSKETGGYGSLSALKDAYEKKMNLAVQEAHEKGLMQGRKEGRELQKQETLKSVQSLGVLIRDFGELKKKILEGAEKDVLELALAVSQKVISIETTTNREVVQNVLRAAMKSIVDRENMKIRLHPQDFQYMMEIKPDFLRSLDGVKNIVFEEDAAIVRGGAIIESLFGEVDARLDHQFNQIRSSLTSPPGDKEF
jgi:flagellar assembly protein FliH